MALDDKTVLDQADRALAGHTLRENPTRSFRFASQGRDSACYWFDLTWTPGTLTLSGDIGEMVVTHYSALREFEAGIRWAERADYDYLLGKAGVLRTQIDKVGTVERIVEWANEDVLWARQREREEALRERAEASAASAQWELAMDWWNVTREGPPPSLYDAVGQPEPCVLGDRPEFRRVPTTWTGTITGREYTSHEGDIEAPDGWRIWHGVFEHLDDYRHTDPSMLLAGAGRRTMAGLLRRAVENMSQDEIAGLCSELELDDFYGRYSYPERSLWQIRAIRRGCSLILDQIEPRRTWGRTWADPVV